jgi:hypothetical protein
MRVRPQSSLQAFYKRFLRASPGIPFRACGRRCLAGNHLRTWCPPNKPHGSALDQESPTPFLQPTSPLPHDTSTSPADAGSSCRTRLDTAPSRRWEADRASTTREPAGSFATICDVTSGCVRTLTRAVVTAGVSDAAKNRCAARAGDRLARAKTNKAGRQVAMNVLLL